MDETTGQHTPGPWVTGNTDPMLFGRKQGNGTEPLGFVYGPSFPERSDVGRRAMANARLIAAAPDLLDSLVNLLGVIDGEGGTKPGAREMAMAAIARAVGDA